MKAQIGLANSAIPALGDASVVKNAACTAYQLNPRDAEPHRTLALLYTRHGLIEDAKRELTTYRDRASFAWQKQEATDYLNEIQKPNSGLVGQLDAPLGLGRPCLLEN